MTSHTCIFCARPLVPHEELIEEFVNFDRRYYVHTWCLADHEYEQYEHQRLMEGDVPSGP